MRGLPPAEADRLTASLEVQERALGERILEAGKRTSYVYFPMTAVVSLLNEFSDGVAIEVGVVGFEGLAGVTSVLDNTPQLHTAIIQMPGLLARMKTDVFRAEFRKGGALQEQVLRYTHLLLMQVSQTAACNRLHNIEQRLARWLLTMSDRGRSPHLTLTQEFLSHMLGTRRAGVNVAVGVIESTGAIAHGRNRISIVDREKLRDLSCECHRLVEAELRRSVRPSGFSSNSR